MDMSIASLNLSRLVAIAMLVTASSLPVLAQDQKAPASASATSTSTAPPAPETQAPEPLSDDELEVLVARIALYPDELVAVISEASLYPLQIVEASRFLDKRAKDNSLQPKDDWDGSVISLLNYPEVVKMMSDDLEWTQDLGDALTYQSKDVLAAIQQLRDEAVAKGIIKSDDKVKVVQENDNVVIQPAAAEKIYVPKYEPEMLYVPNYQPAPVSYYPEPYPSYYYPTATFFAAAVTGAVWAAAVDWDNWDVWGGGWGGDVDIDCNNCLNNINGKVNWNDVDWKNVDRSKIKLDKNQLANFDRTKIQNSIRADGGNSLRNKATNVRNERAGDLGARAKTGDVRKNALDGQRRNAGDLAGVNRPNAGQRPNAASGQPASDRTPASGRMPAR